MIRQKALKGSRPAKKQVSKDCMQPVVTNSEIPDARRWPQASSLGSDALPLPMLLGQVLLGQRGSTYRVGLLRCKGCGAEAEITAVAFTDCGGWQMFSQNEMQILDILQM